MSESFRLIKKYPNRRLYDTRVSAYITLNDVKDFVLSFERFKVVDARTGDDLTRSILLQILVEEETAGAPLLTSELLAQMIRSYGDAVPGLFGKYLESNRRTFLEFEKKIQEQSQSLAGKSSQQIQSDIWSRLISFHEQAMQTMMASYMDQSMRMVHQMQDQLKNRTPSLFSGLSIPGAAAESAKQQNAATRDK